MLPKRKSRRVMVQGHAFRYIISISWNSSNYEFNITVQSEEYNGYKLLFKGLVTRNFWLDFPYIAKDENSYPVITPKHICSYISLAIKEGWAYSEVGENYQVAVDTESLRKTI